MAKRDFNSLKLFMTGIVALSLAAPASAQDQLPRDSSNEEGYSTYHEAPAYRESESHPLRVLAYIVHPIGWLAREVLFRPLSYFASSTPETRMVMGYREPHDIRQPSCFAGSERVPDCREVSPFNYGQDDSEDSDEGAVKKKVVYFPDVNFDFNRRSLNGAGKRKAQMVAKMLLDGEPVDVELQGHTDRRGSEAYNEKLGMDRAKTVKRELVSLGVSEEHLYTVSFGERSPLFTEDEPWAHAANRRVEVHLTNQR